jgi:hypothetical protein
MNTPDLKSIEGERQALLDKLTTAESALHGSLRARGFGETPRAHLERALAHIHEAQVIINETKSLRTVPQLVDDLNRIERVQDEFNQRQYKGQRV